MEMHAWLSSVLAATARLNRTRSVWGERAATDNHSLAYLAADRGCRQAPAASDNQVFLLSLAGVEMKGPGIGPGLASI